MKPLPAKVGKTHQVRLVSFRSPTKILNLNLNLNLEVHQKFISIFDWCNNAASDISKWVMMDTQEIFSLPRGDEEAFRRKALEVFHFQYRHNDVYREFSQHLEVDPAEVTRVADIPFLPVEVFKYRKVLSTATKPEKVFVSSGTSGSVPSRHHVADLQVYEHSLQRGFHLFYGPPEDYCVLALLPGYLERQDASLVYMARRLMEAGRHPDSGFYLDDLDGLAVVLDRLMSKGQKTLLLGVSFALLDFARRHPMPLEHGVVMETGGMKGQHREMVREELHDILCAAFHQKAIHSEYGMTELLSQAYAKKEGVFSCPPWMRVLIRDSNDPLRLTGHGRAGGIQVVDLANVYSCSFLATKDLGKSGLGNTFEVLGRFDHSDVRGCNLMVE